MGRREGGGGAGGGGKGGAGAREEPGHAVRLRFPVSGLRLRVLGLGLLDRGRKNKYFGVRISFFVFLGFRGRGQLRLGENDVGREVRRGGSQHYLPVHVHSCRHHLVEGSGFRGALAYPLLKKNGGPLLL